LGRTPAVLVDAGANAECTPAMLVQFAQMGAAYVSARFGTEAPTVGLLSIGEEPTKGTPLVKETHGLLAAAGGGEFSRGFEFVGNLEGRDLLPSPADVIVTDGFTGNVALKALEGSLRFLFDAMLGIFGTNEETKAAADVLLPYLLPMAAQFEPENTGGAMLLGTDGVCVISHGSSNGTAMVNAVRVAYECATRGLVDAVADAVRPAATA
jgi:glycerol-3-phosphate acyltransferase PlsX